MPYLFSNIPDCSKHPQYIQKPIMIILSLEWSAAVSLRQRFEHLGGDEVGAEEWAVGRHCDICKMRGNFDSCIGFLYEGCEVCRACK
jgi:hypothetical protein